MAVRKTRAQWAAEIRDAHTKTVAAILKLGLTLTAAKKALPHGEFLKMIKSDLPFSASTAQKLMKISADPKLANAARARLLPPAWGTLCELSKLPQVSFEEALKTWTINSGMTRDDATKLVAVTVRYDKPSPPRTIDAKVTHETLRLAAPSYTIEPPIAAPDVLDENIEASLALSQIERLVRDLSAAVQCGDVLVDVMLERRVRDLADRLLSLLTQQRHVAH